MTFYTCEVGCSSSIVQLAESDDGINWELIDGFEPYNGDAPDIISREKKLYLYTSGYVKRYDITANAWDASPVQVSIKDAWGNNVSWMHPSAIVDDNGNLVLFYLNTTGSTGNAEGCNPYPCTKYFLSAVEVEGSDGTEFLQQSGFQLSLSIFSGTASDPDIFYDNYDHYLYVSVNTNTNAYKSHLLHGTYFPIWDLGLLTGEAYAASGLRDDSTYKFWTYGQEGSPSEIRRFVHGSFSTELTDYTVVVDGSSMFSDESIRVENPAICINTLVTAVAGVHKSTYPVKVFPNPFTDYLNIDVETSTESLIFELIDPISNQNILSNKLSGKTTVMKFNRYPAGIYFYRILRDKKMVAVGKLISN